MTAHKNAMVLATYTANALALGQRAMEALELRKDPWIIHWPFVPVNRFVAGDSSRPTSTQAMKYQKSEKATLAERLALADALAGEQQQQGVDGQQQQQGEGEGEL